MRTPVEVTKPFHAGLMAHRLGVVTGWRFAKGTTAHADVSDERSVSLLSRLLKWSLRSRAFVRALSTRRAERHLGVLSLKCSAWITLLKL